MADPLIGFLKEQRHIFGSCPHCQDIFRLTEVRVSYKTTYKPDWMDQLTIQLEKEEARLEAFEEKKNELRQKAIEKERRERLPQLLNTAVPMFAKRKVFPQDVKTLFDPVDFVVFDGMNNEEKVKRVLLMDNEPKTDKERALHQSIQEVIDTGALTWHTVKISREGKIEEDPNVNQSKLGK